MQLNSTTALATALISAIIGFGLAFYIERKLSRHMQKKSQKILTFIALMSFGYGLMVTLNEVIGFPLQGLNIRYDKLVGVVVANMLFLPIVLLAIAKLIGLNNKVVETDLDAQPNQVIGSFFKYFLMLAGALSIAYFGYVALEGGASSSSATYDFYFKVDSTNCNSPYETKPVYSLKFTFKKETNEIYMTVERSVDGVKKMEIQKLENCSVIDSNNWSCGGVWTGPYMSSKYSYVGGVFSYTDGAFSSVAICPAKYIKR